MQGLAVMGHGVVGSGVVELFYMNREKIEARAGETLELKHVLDLRAFPGLAYSDKFTTDFNDILNDPEVTVVAEVMGGLKPAYDYTKQLLLSGKSVVTSNKELVAAKGAELLQIAKENNVNYMFEASVGGGIPVIRPMHQCLAANTFTEVLGILNGTTNFIMTKMIKEGMSFEDALSLAQQLGYAERNPSADVDGHDACRKICILASLAYGKHVYPAQVRTEGITQITATDVAFAKVYNSVIKLIGRTRMLENGKVQCTVSPMLVSKNSPLSMVDDVFNAVMVRGDATGDVMFYGKGA
ncbi:MAG: homoserine dehydrogenase, partial [Clostridia bacterium]|nr:homoserine dehydrogenase [Clostridia bacterium]